MAISLKAFRTLTNGFARSHHFNIGIVDWRDKLLNTKLKGMVAGLSSLPIQSMFCSATNLPSKTITSERVPIHYGIPGINIARNIDYGSWKVTFYSDEMMLLRYFFIRWMELINDTDTQSYSLPGKYKSSLAYASILSPQDVPVHVYTFKGLFPINISAITMQQQDTSIITFDVEFSYDFFKINEPIGFGLAVGHELVGDTIANALGGGRTSTKKRKLNAPLGISVPLPF